MVVVLTSLTLDFLGDCAKRSAEGNRPKIKLTYMKNNNSSCRLWRVRGNGRITRCCSNGVESIL